MIKQAVLLLFAAFCSISLFSQKNAVPADKEKSPSLDKEETIAYLNNKLLETIGHEKYTISQNVFLIKKRIQESHMRKTMTGAVLYTLFKTSDNEHFSYYYFNPKHISSITNSSIDNVGKESPIGTIEIKFIGRVVLFNNNGDSTTTSSAIFHFLQTDPENYKRIYQALMYLKSLYKKEEVNFDVLKE